MRTGLVLVSLNVEDGSGIFFCLLICDVELKVSGKQANAVRQSGWRCRAPVSGQVLVDFGDQSNFTTTRKNASQGSR